VRTNLEIKLNTWADVAVGRYLAALDVALKSAKSRE